MFHRRSPEAFVQAPSRLGPALFAVVLALTVALLMTCRAVIAADPPMPLVSIEGITEYRLDNGLQILLFPDTSRPTVTVNLTVLVGSRHEGYGETGMAHLLEHMVFKGTPDHANIPQALTERGAEFNGTTWVDRTNYYETLTASDDNLEFALALEADRLVNSFVKQEDLLSEMTVVRNEFERGENSPSAVLNQRIMATAFEWHNYGKSTIGNRSDIERVPIGRLKAFYKKYYQPDNCVLVVAGKFEPDRALALIQKHFGKLPKPERKLEEPYTEEPAQDGERLVTLRRVGEVQLVGAAYHVPSGQHPDIAALDVLSNILTVPPSGRLYKALVEKGKATTASANVSGWHDPGVFELESTVRTENSLEEARDILLSVTQQVGAEGVTEEEVARAKQQILKRRELAAADTTSVAIQLSEWVSQGDWRMYFLYRDRIEGVTAEQVKEAAAKYLREDNRTVGLFFPTSKPERVTIPPAPDVSKILADYKGREPISEGEEFDVSPLAIEARVERYALPDGVKVALLPKQTRGDTVQFRLTLRYGNLENLKGFESAAGFLPELMTRGTPQLTRQQIQDELDKNGARLTARGDTGLTQFSLQTKRANLPAVLELFKQILREPTLPEEELDIQKRQLLARLEEQLADPQALAFNAVRRLVSPYDKADVRAIPTIEESIERTKAVTRQQLQTLYKDYLGGTAGEIAIVGDFAAAEIKPYLEALVADWKDKKPYARLPRVAHLSVPGSKQDILTPDKANSVYAAGMAFALRDDNPDYPALTLGNFVLGAGSLSSRLGDRVRQKDGLSYGVASFMLAESLDERASLTIFAIANPANMAKVVTAIDEELRKLVGSGLTDMELAQAKAGYLQQSQVERTDDGALASILAGTLFTGRSMKYYAQFEDSIGKVTADEVLAVMKKYWDPGRLVIITAGDFGALPAAGS